MVEAQSREEGRAPDDTPGHDDSLGESNEDDEERAPPAETPEEPVLQSVLQPDPPHMRLAADIKLVASYQKNPAAAAAKTSTAKAK